MDDANKSETAKGDDAVALIDSLRPNGSFDQARQRLNATAKVIGERIAAAIPGQTWRFTADPNLLRMSSQGVSCDELTGDIARRPKADTVEFGRTFTAEEFPVAAGIVREEAARYGATGESSIFNEQSKRDYEVQGNGFEFNLGQIEFARLHITGGCFLLKP
ncbi:LppA family lipoprotein [Mycobacterium deserti]|uniref:LppA family lipoprotein n=1 Tax=Mycobacterium deserti TaxID=2978347 RepID=A0ABT2MBX4_9MYCO|nr:LppA family lipoprotein [Mycobacterium deserti]MCT7658885.1 LppA family lipoprotein [Mycobacterium deserti]